MKTLRQHSQAAMRRLAVSLVALLSAVAHAAPGDVRDACYVRAEPAPVAEGATTTVPAATQSTLGLRRRTSQLFDVELTVAGPRGAACSVSGVARLRGGANGEVLALPVRPEAAAATRRDASPCLVYLQLTPAGAEITTSEASCQAQALCGGQVQLHGQRFGAATRVPPGTRGPCFAQSNP